MSKKEPVIFSGSAPSGILTIGNYIGALKSWVELQNTYNCYYCIVDMHAITVKQEAKLLRSRTLDFLAQYIATGIDPEKSTLFIQSHVSAHAELAWILSCFSSFGELSRMTQFKDKSKKHEKNINAGLFTYPVLMASDILLYNADKVPVGEDQKQHLELARNLAEKFNNTYSETFVVPEPHILKTGARIMNLQDPTTKMDKSNPNESTYISLVDEPNVIIKKIKRAITDSETTIEYNESRPGISNLLTIFSVLSNESVSDIEKRYHGKGYAPFKQDLGDCIVETLTPIREKYKDLIGNKDYLKKIFQTGAEKAAYVANRTLQKVQRKVGFVAKS